VLGDEFVVCVNRVSLNVLQKHGDFAESLEIVRIVLGNTINELFHLVIDESDLLFNGRADVGFHCGSLYLVVVSLGLGFVWR